MPEIQIPPGGRKCADERAIAYDLTIMGVWRHHLDGRLGWQAAGDWHDALVQRRDAAYPATTDDG
jgi:hypothetical protein